MTSKLSFFLQWAILTFLCSLKASLYLFSFLRSKGKAANLDAKYHRKLDNRNPAAAFHNQRLGIPQDLCHLPWLSKALAAL